MTKRKRTKGKLVSKKQTKTGEQPIDAFADINAILKKHSLKLMAGIFVLSLLISAWYYQQGKNTPLRSVHQWENSDMAFFDTWASYLAEGNWWCDTVLHPYHDWHETFATSYFAAYPEEAAGYRSALSAGSQVDELTAKKNLVNDIYKGKVFHQEPLYPYMVAVTYALFGKDHKWVYFWNFLLAAFTSVLVYLIGKKQFNELTGILAALFVTLCGTILVYQMVLFRTTMTNFFTVLLLYFYLRMLEKPSRKSVAVFGVVSGVSILSQSYVILFILPAMIWFGWENREKLRETGIQVSVFFGSLLLILSPLFLRNYKADVPLMALASHGAMTYIPNNTTFSNPMESFNVHIPTLVKLRHEGGGSMIPTAFLCLETFSSIGDFWRIYKQKINGMFMWHELPNNMNYFLYKEYAPILGHLPIRYFFLAPLGLIGLLLGIYTQRQKFIPFALMVLTCMAPLLIAGNLARYRTPFVIMMAIAAAFCFVEIVHWAREKNWKMTMIGSGLVLLAFLYTANTPPKHVFEYSSSDISIMYSYHFRDKLMALEQAGDNEGYLEQTTKLMEYIPDYFFEAPLKQKVQSENEANACLFVVNLIRMHAGSLQIMNKQKEANFYNDKADILYKRGNKYKKKMQQ